MRAGADITTLPTGTVTFMFTDIEGSTTILHQVGEARFAEMLAAHRGLISDELAAHGGTEVGSEGDSVFAVFTDPLSAVTAALEIQRRVGGDESTRDLRVRIGLHTGNGTLAGADYVGVDVHRASRISDSAHGGQVLISDITARLVEDRLPADTIVKVLGRYRLAGFPEPSALHQVQGPGLQHEFPPLRSAPAESELPAPLTDFVGRAEEVSTGLQILEAHRLLTLTGPGGTGKTRLALEIARQAEPGFNDGAYFVALASLTDPDLIPMTILETLRIKTAAGVDPLDHLRHHLEQRSLLLLLDNFEQLLDGAPSISDLLGAAPGLSLIVTSRSPLRVAGERELSVPPLGLPPQGAQLAAIAGADGVRLFVSRAEAVNPDFQLDADNVESISAITRALDGLPLAIELAASRLRSLTPELVLERLNNQLLSATASHLPARQQTIVNTISWSYDLLDERAKELFEQLSVFSGPFGLTEAEAVCEGSGDVLDGISNLTEQSLLRQTSTSGEPRFRMLTVIREFAYAALVARGRDRELLDLHAQVYLDLAAAADREILTSHQDKWLRRLSADHDNLRAAFDHAVATGDAESALSFVGHLWRFWQIRGHLYEARQRAETALAMEGESSPMARSRALTALGGIVYWQGSWQEMLVPYEEALKLARAANDDAEISEALYNLSFALGYDSDIDQAEALLRESLELSEGIGRTIGVGRAHWGLANMGAYREDFSPVIDHLERAIEVFTGIDAPFDLGWAHFMLAHSRFKMAETEGVFEPELRALEIFAAVDDLSALVLILELLSALMLSLRQDDRAAYFAGAAQRIKENTGVAIGDVDLNQYEQMSEFLEGIDLSTDLYPHFLEGYNAPLDEVVAAARGTLSERV